MSIPDFAVNFGKELITRVHAARFDVDLPDSAASAIYWTIFDRLKQRHPDLKPESPAMLQGLIRYAASRFVDDPKPLDKLAEDIASA